MKEDKVVWLDPDNYTHTVIHLEYSMLGKISKDLKDHDFVQLCDKKEGDIINITKINKGLRIEIHQHKTNDLPVNITLN